MQDAVGLVNLRSYFNLHYDLLGGEFDDADTELLVHVPCFTESGVDLVSHRTSVEVGR